MPLLSYIKAHHPAAFSALKNLRSFLLSAIMEDGTNRTGSSAAADDVKDDPQPPFDPLKPGFPVSYPLKTLEELESRAYFDSFHFPFNRAAVELRRPELPNRPRILVCHDMAGGYSEDRFVQGGGNPDAYAIWHWYLIDVFVYFSHSLVTLPPPCWTNAAHKHGVKVLGTFILEWDEGKKMADKLLSTMDSVKMYADRLKELAVALGFDGWLLNFEVKLDIQQIPNLKAFISHLSQAMHSSLPGSLVIWYDSVTVDGDLSWQDQLNDKNKPFFDLCDGIFMNYTWKENYPKLSADTAGDRKFDVYMGIDVFGRNTFGGGGWTTNVALDVIKKSNVSAAIFAPGWIYETKQPPNFQTAQNKWWGLIENSWGTVQNYPKELPFYSNFDQGHGYYIYHDGKQVSDIPWNNISSQSFQPFLQYSEDSAAQPIQVSMNFKDASYNGGGDITFTGTLVDDAEFMARLFKGELLFGNSSVHFTYSVKASENSLLGLALLMSFTTEKEKTVLLAASGDALLTTNQFASRFSSVIMPRRVTNLGGWVTQQSSIAWAGWTLKEIHAVCYKTIARGPSEYYAALGDIKITTDEEQSKFPPANAWLVDAQFVSWAEDPQGSKRLSVKLIWHLNVDTANVSPKYNIYIGRITGSPAGNENRLLAADREYLGVATGEAYYVSDLEVPPGITSLKFVVQACGLDGTFRKFEDSPFILLPVKES